MHFALALGCCTGFKVNRGPAFALVGSLVVDGDYCHDSLTPGAFSLVVVAIVAVSDQVSTTPLRPYVRLTVAAFERYHGCVLVLFVSLACS